MVRGRDYHAVLKNSVGGLGNCSTSNLLLEVQNLNNTLRSIRASLYEAGASLHIDDTAEGLAGDSPKPTDRTVRDLLREAQEIANHCEKEAARILSVVGERSPATPASRVR